MNASGKVGFGGGCHWCTEAIFQSLRGSIHVDQGWISSTPPNESFSEAVIVVFDPARITLSDLIRVHLHSHSSTSNHSMRRKYRSAVYAFDREQMAIAGDILTQAQTEFDRPIVTRVLPFRQFRLNERRYRNYYASNPNRPFCQTAISPKLVALRRDFPALLAPQILTMPADSAVPLPPTM